jgi:hypothetical protein
VCIDIGSRESNDHQKVGQTLVPYFFIQVALDNSLPTQREEPSLMMLTLVSI